MEIVMIKKKGCNPCKLFQPIIKKLSEKNNLHFRTIQAEDMPLNIRPDIFPFFYLRDGDKLIESWGGTNERKMQSVLKRNLENFTID